MSSIFLIIERISIIFGFSESSGFKKLRKKCIEKNIAIFDVSNPLWTFASRSRTNIKHLVSTLKNVTFTKEGTIENPCIFKFQTSICLFFELREPILVIRGSKWPHWGALSEGFEEKTKFWIFGLLFSRKQIFSNNIAEAPNQGFRTPMVHTAIIYVPYPINFHEWCILSLKLMLFAPIMKAFGPEIKIRGP